MFCCRWLYLLLSHHQNGGCGFLLLIITGWVKKPEEPRLIPSEYWPRLPVIIVGFGFQPGKPADTLARWRMMLAINENIVMVSR